MYYCLWSPIESLTSQTFLFSTLNQLDTFFLAYDPSATTGYYSSNHNRSIIHIFYINLEQNPHDVFFAVSFFFSYAETSSKMPHYEYEECLPSSLFVSIIFLTFRYLFFF